MKLLDTRFTNNKIFIFPESKFHIKLKMDYKVLAHEKKKRFGSSRIFLIILIYLNLYLDTEK